VKRRSGHVTNKIPFDVKQNVKQTTIAL
jgi:hypothetical protein